jgi:hypothetical protein
MKPARGAPPPPRRARIRGPECLLLPEVRLSEQSRRVRGRWELLIVLEVDQRAWVSECYALLKALALHITVWMPAGQPPHRMHLAGSLAEAQQAVEAAYAALVAQGWQEQPRELEPPEAQTATWLGWTCAEAGRTETDLLAEIARQDYEWASESGKAQAFERLARAGYHARLRKQQPGAKS